MSPDAALEIRPMTRAEFPALQDFYRKLLPAGAKVASVLAWREAAPEASGGNAPWGAWLDGTLVGTVNTVPLTIHGLGRSLKVAWQGDSIVAPESRGRGVAKSIVRAAAATTAAVLVKGSVERMYGIRKSIGFRDVPNDDYLMRPVRPWSNFGSVRRRVGFPGLWLGATLRTRPLPDPALEVRPLARFGPWFDELAVRLREAPYLGPVKSSEYLEWRYRSDTTRSYETIEVVAGQSPRGAAVLRMPERAGEDAWLLDVIAPLDDGAAVRALIRAAVRRAGQSGAGMIKSFATSTRAREHLRREGFMSSGATPHFTFLVTNAPDELLPPAADWNFWHGDGDNELY